MAWIRRGREVVVTVALASGIWSCGADTATDAGVDGAPVDASPALTVLETSPDADATGISPDLEIVATFSADLAPVTVTTSTFRVSLDGNDVAGSVTYAPETRRAIFVPDDPMALLGEYTATIAAGVTDVAGTSLAEPFSWSFTVRDRLWTAPQLLELDEAGDAQYPRVVIDDVGNATAVWQQAAANGVNDIMASRYTGGLWSPAVAVETSSAGTTEPQLAVDSSGTVTVVWTQFDSGALSVWAARFAPVTGWSSPVVLESASETAFAPFVAASPSGDVVVVWEQFNVRWNIWANRFTAASGWGTPVLLETDDAGPALYARVVVDLSGNATAVWAQSDGTRYSMWAARFDPVDGWGSGTLLETDDDEAGGGELVVDGNGNVTVVWSSYDGTGNRAWANRFEATGDVWGSAILLVTEYTSGADIGVGASGHVTALWSQDSRTTSGLWTSELDAGSGWSTPTLVASDPFGAWGPSLSVSPSGESVAVWDNSLAEDIWASHRPSGGSWGIPTKVEVLAGNGFNAHAAAAASGEAIVVWSHRLDFNDPLSIRASVRR